ncbi:MAG: type pilus assembly protein PilB [Patescibacteria group bacterium]|jgi:type IV pilus assembly protein PilB|nr:type pilus assembly protein PilB [Patescibacteria group bacterium]
MVHFDEDKQDKRIERLRLQEEEDLARILAETKYNIPYIDLTKVVIENEALNTIPEDEAREIEVAPFNISGKKILIAVHAPERNEVVSIKKTLENKGYKVSFFMASKKSLEKVWQRYEEVSKTERIKAGSLSISGETLLKTAEKIKTLPDIEKSVTGISEDTSTHKVSKIIEAIFAGAIALKASDVHIEPQEGHVDVRIRLDGILHEVLKIDFKTYNFINSRIKLISGLKLSKDQAQDGRFSIWLNDYEISMRTSVIPSAYGEGIVMRILNPQSIMVEMEELGIEKKLFKIIERTIEKPNGLILVTGPTGSGKTTTLYTFLRRIYSPEIKILTIENPVEYHLEGITQTQTDHKKGYGFLEGLRSALRQDPDVIMVGEIRDGETAKIAVESSLTGHMVFSTLHTNNAAGAVPRLIDLGVNPKILSSALSMSLAQRLVRKLCTNCRQKREVTEEENQIIKKILTRASELGKDLASYNVKADQKIELWKAVGCEKCNKIGYKGRIGIFEAILSDETIIDIMPNNPSEREIKKVAEKQGIMDMKEDGIIKSLSGITSLEEVKKVVDIYEDIE